jgi:hypothetical protein
MTLLRLVPPVLPAAVHCLPVLLQWVGAGRRPQVWPLLELVACAWQVAI